MRTAVFALIGALVLGGCAQLQQAPSAAGETEAPQAPSADGETGAPQAPGAAVERRASQASPTDTDRLLALFSRARGLPQAQLAREQEDARRAMLAEASEFQRMRYAMTLSVSIDGAAAAARVVELLEPIAVRRDSPLQALAEAFRSLLQDLHRVHGERAELLRKLDSIKALEKSLSNREHNAQ